MRAEELKEIIGRRAPDWENIQEVRIRVGRPVTLLSDGRELTVEGAADRQLIRDILEILSKHSLYAFEDEIRQGFLTVEGGHRVGLAGKAVTEKDGTLRTIRDISALNIRLAHEKKGCADRMMPYLYGTDGTVSDTLILSPPGAGKTTLLRDMIRQVSEGTRFGAGCPVSVVDERSELAACFQGIPQHDLGSRTDVMDACPKVCGMYMMIRSMSPQVLAVDEIGTAEDLEAVRYVMNCGCRILATIHAGSVEDLRLRPVLSEMMREKMFSRYVVLAKQPGPGTVLGIYDAAGKAVRP